MKHPDTIVFDSDKILCFQTQKEAPLFTESFMSSAVWEVEISPPSIASICLLPPHDGSDDDYHYHNENHSLSAAPSAESLRALLVEALTAYTACIDPDSYTPPSCSDDDIMITVGQGITMRLARRSRSLATARPFGCSFPQPDHLPVVFSTMNCSPSEVHYRLTFRSSVLAFREMSRQHNVRCQMALAQTMGGGWASVKNAKEALKCAMQLYSLAEQIGDEATMRKCRVFVGWALMWVGKLDPALLVFYGEQQNAATVGDDSNYQRCVAALLHHAAGSEAVHSRSHGQELGSEWTSLFQADDTCSTQEGQQAPSAS